MIKRDGDLSRISSKPKFIAKFLPKPNFSNKKAQVTVFIIIGIIILFTFAGIMYFTKTFTKQSLIAAEEPALAEIPSEFQPIQIYTDSCLTQIGKKALLILGEQGGYINPALIGKYSAANPTDADGLDLEPLKVPFWHYNSKPNQNLEVGYSSLQPKLYAKEDPEMSIESQLSRFVEEKLDDCLKDYTAFADQGFQVEIENKEAKEVIVAVGESSVNFWLKMQIKAQKGDAEQEIDQFYVKLPVKLKQYYEVANQITQVEREHQFLESQAQDLIATFSAVDSEKLPPTEAVTFDAVPTAIWAEEDVKLKFKELLASYVPMLRYLGSSNFYRYDYGQSTPNAAAVTDLSDLYQKNYDNMILPLELGQSLNLNFDYFSWEPYFNLNDKGGAILPSSFSANFWKLNFNTNHYYTTYDVSYPVLITINDPEALQGAGYKFVFALEANLRNNEIVQSGDVLSAPIAAVSQSMACDEDKRNTELIKTIVVDSFSKEPVEAVQIGFSLPGFDDCILGTTDSSGEFASEYPAVYGGVGSYIKPEYLTNFYPVDTYQYKKSPGIIGYAVAGLPEKVIELHRYKTIPVKVKKKSLEKCISGDCYAQGLFGSSEGAIESYTPQMLDSKHSWVFNGAAKTLSEKETATIMLKRIGDLNPRIFNDDFAATAVVSGDQSVETELVPGIYEVNALLTNENQLVIPTEERCTGGVLEAVACWDSDGCCFTYEENVLDQYLSGQLLWNDQKSYLTITPEQLYGAKELTFYVLDFNLASVPEKAHYRVMEDLGMMGKMGNFSRDLRESLEPKFS